jgi:ubiquinone biosynthesis protein
VPALLARAGHLADQLDAITRNGLLLAPETVAAIGASEARRTRWMTIALWVIAALVAWFVWMIYRAM